MPISYLLNITYSQCLLYPIVLYLLPVALALLAGVSNSDVGLPYLDGSHVKKY